MGYMPRQVSYSFYDEMYGVKFYLLCPTTIEKLELFVKAKYKLELNNPPPNVAGCCLDFHTDKGSEIVIALLTPFDWKPESINTLVHECYHAAEFVLRDRGVQSNKTTSEAWAYYIGYLVEKCLSKLKKRKRAK